MKKRFLTVVTAVMIIVLGMILLAFFLSIWHNSAAEKKRESEFIRAFSRQIMASKTDKEREKTLDRVLNDCEFVRAHEILRDGEPSSKGGLPSTLPDITENITDPDGAKWVIKIWHRPASIADNLPGTLVPFLLVMISGTIFLLFTLYILISRLVIKPIESLAAATEQMAKGNDELRVNVPHGRKDEIAKLIKNFNYMAEQIADYRQNLEQKIERAKMDISRAERGLVTAQRINATGKLAAGIAHEINNPLGGMINALNKLKSATPEQMSEEKRLQYLDLLHEGLLRIQETVRQILQFSSSRSVAEPRPLDLRQALNQALAFAEFRLRTLEIEIHVDWPDTFPQVKGRINELQQVFLNLILNASDAMENSPKKRLKIKGFCENTELRGKMQSACGVEISDTGTGMSAEQVSQAFDLFYTTKEAGKGTGLGLSIAHNIIQNHGGELQIISASGTGTTITISLPAYVSQENDGY